MPKKNSGNKGPRKKSAAEIAEAAMPGWKAVIEEEQAGDAVIPAKPDANLPSINELRKKYLSGKASLADTPEHMAPKDDTEVVTMAFGPHKKKVGVKGGKVHWSQG